MDFHVESQLVAWVAGTGAKEETKQKLRRELDEVAAALAGPSPSPAERMLAEVAALNWFALRLFESCYAGASYSKGGMTLAQSEHAQRRIDRAHRRLLASLKTLATVRKLALPAIQVNVASQQVNVAGPT